jgi:UDP-GlcNAc:undecaprenyl-phosphate GlcNAc-1-phosphate transferase
VRFIVTEALFVLPLISLLVGFSASALGSWLSVIDQPGGEHKTHSIPTPLVGGMAIATPFLLACALELWQSPESLLHGALLLAVGAAFLLGYFDDRAPMSSRFRLLAGTALALACVTMVPSFVVEAFNFAFLSEPISLQPFAILFSVLVIVGLMNAVNMADGTNGLACGLCLIWTLFFLVFAPPEVYGVLVVLAVSTFVTLIFNLRGKLFLGDSGSYALGLTISLLSIYVYNNAIGTLHADVVVVWFLVPVVDCLRLMTIRACERRSPTSPDTNHLHHRLHRLVPRSYALLIYWLLVAIPGAFAIAMPSLAGYIVLGVFGVYLGLLGLTSSWLPAVKLKIQASYSPD